MRFCDFHQIRRFSSKFYVTTPIFYVNAAPHIGHLYTAVIADAIARFQKLKNPEKVVFLCTGTDEHGSKIQQAAAKNDQTPKEYCDFIAEKYKKLFDEAAVRPSRFIRTTEKDHVGTVEDFWSKLQSKNVIYKTKYCGWYCVSDENFLAEKETKVVNGQRVSEESGHPVEWTEEENYMFKLNQMQPEVIKWASAKDRIKPSKFQKILLDQLEHSALPDLSVSRPTSRVSWGIRVPGDESQTIYVWLDALVNYYSAIRESNQHLWPPFHVIGKDIIKFHAIYWPAFLMAADMEPPEQLLVHSHWTVDGQKMSKSKFNVVDPMERAKIYTMEGIRYFLLREGVSHSDGNYSETKIHRILNAELADTFGNLLSRASGKSLNPRQVFPLPKVELQTDEFKHLLELRTLLPEKTLQQYENFNFYQVVDSVIQVLHSCNKFFEAMRPWELKNELDLKETVLSETMETLRICSIILQPIIPKLTDRVLTKMNIQERNWRDLDTKLTQEMPLGSESAAVFQRIILEKKETAPSPPPKKQQKIKKKNA